MNYTNVILNYKQSPIFFDDSFNSLLDIFLRKVNSRKILIITDTNVENLYFEQVMNQFKLHNALVTKYVILDGERSKSLDAINKIYSRCMEAGLDRGSCIIALGGGVVGDIAGFAASTYMRGINFVQIPTTLLAQIDSSIGGKTGVNYKGYKNIIGSFYQPKLVYINISALNTLPERELLSGMAEVIKYGIIADSNLFQYIEKNSDNILALEKDKLHNIIKRSCKIKADIVSMDEKESGLRAILNFGHTIGHAIESASNFKLTHGESVALGMVCEAELSAILSSLSESNLLRIISIINKYRLPTNLNEQMIKDFVEYLRYDKKVINGELSLYLIESIGKISKKYSIDADDIMNITLKWL